MTFLLRLVFGAVLAYGARVAYETFFAQGTITVEYRETNNRTHQGWRTSYIESRGLEHIASAVDATFSMPRDLALVAEDCGEANAFYDRSQARVSLCYELLQAISDDFAPLVRTDEELARAIWDVVVFVMYHETGHALVHLREIPITGKEEDAVDQLATLLLLGAGAEGRDAALRGAEWFYRVSERQRGRLEFWDSHSLDQQRYFNIICWVYGSDPEAHKVLLRRDWGLPKERAERCLSEYTQMWTSWNKIL